MKVLAFASVFNPGNSSLPVLELLLIFIQMQELKLGSIYIGLLLLLFLMVFGSYKNGSYVVK